MLWDEILPRDARFRFHHGPTSVPGDLRIAWRLAVVVLVLAYSRGQKASLAKLHLLNDALRSADSAQRLADVLARRRPFSDWTIRVEPALGRAIDMARGEGLITARSGRVYQLAGKGQQAAEFLKHQEGVLTAERSFLSLHGSEVTEAFTNEIVRFFGSQSP